MAPRFLLAGYYGFHNIGDDWVLQNTQSLLLERYPNAAITVWAKHDIDGYETIHRGHVFSLLRQFRRTDVLCFGGGGVFQDQSSFRSLIAYVGLVLLARLLGVRIWLLGQGVSAFRYRVSKQLFAWVCCQADVISVRDEASADVVESLIGERPLVHHDLAFLDRRDVARDQRSAVGVSLRDHVNLQAQSKRLKALFESQSIVGLVAQPSDASVLSDFGVDDCLSGDQFLSWPRFNGVIAMRYHVCVWALLQGIPCLALIYDDKVKSLAEQFDIPYVDLRVTYEQEVWDMAVSKFRLFLSSGFSRVEISQDHFDPLRKLIERSLRSHAS